MAQVDIEEGHSMEESGNSNPKAWQLQGFASAYMKEWFDSQPSEKKRRICKERIIKRISKINAVNDVIPKSLYAAEEDVNGYGSRGAWELSALCNIRWWHRNISRSGFAINGVVTAYPDLIVMIEKGKVLLVETKGDHLKNDESEKAEIGATWAAKAFQLGRGFSELNLYYARKFYLIYVNRISQTLFEEYAIKIPISV